MKVNSKIKQLVLQYVNTNENKKKHFSIFVMSFKEKNKLFEIIIQEIGDESFFVYKKGTTKFNDALYVISKNNIDEYLSDNYIIYTIDTLDSLMITEFESSPYNKEGIEIYVSGKFVELLKPIAQNFQYDSDESSLPSNFVK